MTEISDKDATTDKLKKNSPLTESSQKRPPVTVEGRILAAESSVLRRNRCQTRSGEFLEFGIIWEAGECREVAKWG